MSAIGTKRTSACELHMSAFDPKRILDHGRRKAPHPSSDVHQDGAIAVLEFKGSDHYAEGLGRFFSRWKQCDVIVIKYGSNK